MIKKSLATVTQIKDQDIPCMLMPMLRHVLLVPTTTIAEMSTVKPLQSIGQETPPWLLGLYEWRGVNVPVISIEAINGERVIPLNPQGRIAVLNNTGVNKDLPFIAIHTQGIPRMTRVSEEDITEDDSRPRRPFDTMAVKVGMEEFYIPDITAIEMAYLSYMEKR